MKAKLILRADPLARIYRLIRFTYAKGTRQFTIGLRPQIFDIHREYGGTITTILGVRFHHKRGGIWAD